MAAAMTALRPVIRRPREQVVETAPDTSPEHPYEFLHLRVRDLITGQRPRSR